MLLKLYTVVKGLCHLLKSYQLLCIYSCSACFGVFMNFLCSHQYLYTRAHTRNRCSVYFQLHLTKFQLKVQQGKYHVDHIFSQNQKFFDAEFLCIKHHSNSECTTPTLCVRFRYLQLNVAAVKKQFAKISYISSQLHISHTQSRERMPMSGEPYKSVKEWARCFFKCLF